MPLQKPGRKPGSFFFSDWVLLATLSLPAFALHTFLELADADDPLIRTTVGARRTFFEHRRALTTYLPFESWTRLMDFMMRALEIGPPAVVKS